MSLPDFPPAATGDWLAEPGHERNLDRLSKVGLRFQPNPAVPPKACAAPPFAIPCPDMKPPHRATLYGTGLLLAFGAGWFFKPAPSPDKTAALCPPALPSKKSGPPIPQKPVKALAAPGANWLDAAAADVAAVRAAMQPGVVNQVLIDKLENVLNLTDRFQRLASWQGLMTEMQPEDAPLVRGIFRERDKEGRWAAEELKIFLHQWGSIDGSAAATAISKEGKDDEYLPDIMSGWGKLNAEEALAWLKSRESIGADAEALLSIYKGLASISLEAGESFLMAHSNDLAFRNIIPEASTTRVNQQGIHQARNWFKQVEQSSAPEIYKKGNFKALIDLTERLESETAVLDLILPYQNKPWLPEDAGKMLATHWFLEDHIDALAKIEKLNSPDAKEGAAVYLMWNWARRDSETLSGWLNHNQNHPLFDHGAYQLIETIRATDAEAALLWSGKIKNESLRFKAMNPEPDPFASE